MVKHYQPPEEKCGKLIFSTWLRIPCCFLTFMNLYQCNSLQECLHTACLSSEECGRVFKLWDVGVLCLQHMQQIGSDGSAALRLNPRNCPNGNAIFVEGGGLLGRLRRHPDSLFFYLLFQDRIRYRGGSTACAAFREFSLAQKVFSARLLNAFLNHVDFSF